MKGKESKLSFFINKQTLSIFGILALLLLAAVLLWHGNVTSTQAQLPLVAQVYFEGEYCIAEGEWKRITEGEHITSTKGDVRLRGNFHMLAPDGEYVGIYRGETPIAFYLDHINLSFYEGENGPFVVDVENPLYGDSACGACWTAYTFMGEEEETIEILVKNPHGFGNENAIDHMLSKLAFWTGIEFEKDILALGQSQRDLGLLLVIVALMFLGTAVFSALIHIKNAKIIWILGSVIFLAGTYLSYHAEGIYFWNESVVTNTTVLGLSMMLYPFFLSMAMVYLLKKTKTVGLIVVIALGAVDAILFVLPVVSRMHFYDTWFPWALIQCVANLVMLGCLTEEFFAAEGKMRWLYAGLVLPLLAFGLDVVMIGLGLWDGALACVGVFAVFFVGSVVAMLRIIPQSINALAKAKELETEKLVLNAQLTESRVSTMMSQIRPHFIYNTLGSIEQLCSLDPPKAGELVHNFAKYLRGNFRELDNPKPILMSREMEHVHHYVSIENVRFPDMTFSFEMNSVDFYIPALTVQPIVENAIKHGLMKLPKGGFIRVLSYETSEHYCVSVEDNGAGFDTSELLDERKHLGLRNIRERLKAMVQGSLEIESSVGVGTKVLIRIPKEVRQ